MLCRCWPRRARERPGAARCLVLGDPRPEHHGGRGYGSKNSSSWMLPGPPKTCTATSCGDAMNWTRRWIATALAAGLTTWFAALAPPAASAAPPAGAPTLPADFPSSSPAVNPCPAGTGTVGLAGQDVLHVTDFGGGIFHLVDHQTGTATFPPDDPAAVTLAGHYTTTSSEQANPPGLQFTAGGPFNVVGTGPYGSRVVFHPIERTTQLPDGTVTVSFSVTHFECLPPGA